MGRLFILVFVALRYTMTSSAYCLKVMKICYVDKQTSWASYGKVSTPPKHCYCHSTLPFLSTTDSSAKPHTHPPPPGPDIMSQFVGESMSYNLPLVSPIHLHPYFCTTTH
jgi:hypothetical protein